MHNKISIIISTIIIVFLTGCSNSISEKLQKIDCEDVVVGKVSPNGKRLAFLAICSVITGYNEFLDARTSKVPFMIIDGRRQSFNIIGNDFTFSPDSKRFVYIIGDNFETFQNYYVMIDDKKSSSYDAIGSTNIPFFSPNSQRVAYAARKNGKWFALVDGEKMKSYDCIAESTPFFSPDSKHVVYGACINKDRGDRGHYFRVVVDEKESQEEYSCIGSLTYSPDSQHLAYVVCDENKVFKIVIDGQEKYQYDEAVNIVFSPDSKRMAYAARRGNKWFLVVDGNEEKQYDGIGNGSLIFSPDSKQVACAAVVGNKWFMVINGKEGKKYDSIGKSSFSPDSKQLAYFARLNEKWFIVLNGKEENKYYDQVLDDIHFDSNDSFHCLAFKNDSGIYLIEGKLGWLNSLL